MQESSRCGPCLTTYCSTATHSSAHARCARSVLCSPDAGGWVGPPYPHHSHSHTRHPNTRPSLPPLHNSAAVGVCPFKDTPASYSARAPTASSVPAPGQHHEACGAALSGSPPVGMFQPGLLQPSTQSRDCCCMRISPYLHQRTTSKDSLTQAWLGVATGHSKHTQCSWHHTSPHQPSRVITHTIAAQPTRAQHSLVLSCAASPPG
jgi:hypothetical protein